MIAHLGRAVARAHVRYSELIFTCSAPRSLFRTVTTQHYPLLQRNLIDTGLTRGKKLAVLVGQRRRMSEYFRVNRGDKVANTSSVRS